MRILFYLFLPVLAFAVPMPPNRPVNLPFITGDAFRSLSDFAYDELTRDLKPEEVREGSVIFVKTDYVQEFFEKIHPQIQHPYVIISHNSDHAAPGSCAKYLDSPKLIAWFAQNYDGTPHPKMQPIPIGLANGHWPHGNVKTLNKVIGLNLPKKHLAYMNIAVQTFPAERKVVFDHLASQSFCLKEQNVSHEPFLKSIASSVFVVAPRGNGLDTHRLWEALYLGSIPLVKTSSIDAVYDGLPVLVVKDWSEVTEDFLKTAKAEIGSKSWSRDRIFMDYWMRKIRETASSSKTMQLSQDSSKLER